MRKIAVELVDANIVENFISPSQGHANQAIGLCFKFRQHFNPKCSNPLRTRCQHDDGKPFWQQGKSAQYALG